SPCHSHCCRVNCGTTTRSGCPAGSTVPRSPDPSSAGVRTIEPTPTSIVRTPPPSGAFLPTRCHPHPPSRSAVHPSCRASDRGVGEGKAAILSHVHPDLVCLLRRVALVGHRNTALDLSWCPLGVDDRALVEGQGEHPGLGGRSGKVVEDEVAQPVVHVGIVHVPTGGQHVRVAAHDGARPGRDEFVGQVGRVRKRAVRPLQSPVQVDDDVVDLLGGLGDRLDHSVLHLVFGGGHAGAVLTGGPV